MAYALSMATTHASSGLGRIEEILGDDAEPLLTHVCETIPKERLALPGPDAVERIWIDTDRSPRVLGSLQRILDHGRLGGTGYVSILPVDQGIEHSAGRVVRQEPRLLRSAQRSSSSRSTAAATRSPRRSACSARARARTRTASRSSSSSTTTSSSATRTRYDQIMFASVKQAFDHGLRRRRRDDLLRLARGVKRQIQEVTAAFAAAHELGMATVLWCYLRNSAFNKTKDGGPDYHVAADLTGQANHLGVTIEADIIKQKLPETAAPGFTDINFGKTDQRVYSRADDGHPIDMTPLPGGELLHGPRRPDQLGRRVGRQRPRRRRQHRRHQQARRRHWA